jgi:two-component system NarL family sensor kinase
VKNIPAAAQNFLDDPAVHAVGLATGDVTKQRGLEASLLLANAQVADLKEKLKGAAETERKYIAAELHDDVQQILFGLGLNMAASRRELADQLTIDLVGVWMQTVQTAMEHLHEVTVVLRKPSIDNQELPGAMKLYVETLPLAPNQTVLFDTDAKVGTLDPHAAIACFRIVQEALGNAIKHSGASNLLVRLRSSVDRLTVWIRDDGVGFDVKDACAHALDAGSIGLSSMRERAALAGGIFNIQSSIGHGTRIRVSFPIEVLVRQV